MKYQISNIKYQIPNKDKKPTLFEIGTYLRLDIGNFQQGFTLVELLAVIIVFMIIGTLIASILVTSLRTTNRTNALDSVRSNGDYALSEISKLIRNARVLDSPFPCGSFASPTTTTSATITTPDGYPVVFSCTDSTIASNDASLVDTNTVMVSNCLFTCMQTTSSDYPVMTIQFSLQQLSSGNLFENRASSSAIPFETSVVLRNINR